MVLPARRLGNDGLLAWKVVQERGYEGLVAKDPTSPYVGGRAARAWLKVKVRQEGRFVVGGVVERSEGWSLLLGVAEGRQLRYRGLVHWGVGRRLADALTRNGLVRRTSPFSARVPVRRVVWLEPRLVAEVSYARVMRDGLRAPVFRRIVSAEA